MNVSRALKSSLCTLSRGMGLTVRIEVEGRGCGGPLIVGGPSALEGVRHLQSAHIWDLASDDEARLGVRRAVSDAWPKLQAALVAAFDATAVKAAANIPPAPRAPNIAGAATSPSSSRPAAGLATLEGYAALCGAVQMNCVGVKVHSP